MLYTVIILVVVVVAWLLWSRVGGKGIQRISATDLAAELSSGSNSMRVIDVREPSEFKRGHIAQAKNIPLGLLDKKLSEFAKDDAVVFVCHSGTRSMMAARKAKKAGLTAVYNMSGGMSAWAASVKR